MSVASPTSTRWESRAVEKAPTLADSDAMDWLRPGKVPVIMLCRAADDLSTAFIASVAAAVWSDTVDTVECAAPRVSRSSLSRAVCASSPLITCSIWALAGTSAGTAAASGRSAPSSV